MSCGIGRRHGSDPMLLWFWHRPAATALIRPVAWEPPYDMGAALENPKKKRKKRISFWPVLAFNILSSLNLLISSF